MPGGLIIGLIASALWGEQKPPAVIAYVFTQGRTLQPGEIAPGSLTRINYAFANIRGGQMVEGFPQDAANLAFLTLLRKQNPHLEIFASVGGWMWSGAFSDLAMKSASRAKFIDSAVRFVERYHLDGLDIDWEYPGLAGNGNPFRPEDAENFTALIRELRLRLDRESGHLPYRLGLSIAAGASAEHLAHTDMRSVSRYVDTVNLMAYDYVEPSSSPTTGHHAPLYTNPKAPQNSSADASVRAYLSAGVPAQRLVLGVPFYGHAWSQVGKTNHGLFQPGKSSSVDATYNNIVATLLGNGFVRYWDPAASAPYLYNAGSRTFVSYDDPESVAIKAKYVLRNHLAGIMFWEYYADFHGALLHAIDQTLHQ